MKTLIAAALTLALVGSVATAAQADERSYPFEQRDHDRNDDRHRDGNHDNDRRDDNRQDNDRHDDDRGNRDFDDRHDNDRHNHWWYRDRHDHDRYERSRYERSRYEHDRYYKPPGYRYRAWRHGDRLPRAYCADRYIVRDYRAVRLRPPPRGYYWVRVDNDVLLTAIATGLVAQAVYGVF